MKTKVRALSVEPRRRWIARSIGLVAMFVVILGLFWNQDPEFEVSGKSMSADVSGASTGKVFLSPEATAKASVVGVVVSSEGQAIGEAQVCLSPWNVGTLTVVARCVEAAADGSFEFAGLGLGGYIVTASMQGFAAASANRGRPLFLEKAGTALQADVTLEHDGVKLSGVVRDGTGGTVAGAVVRAATFDPPSRLEAQSGQEGEFAFWLPRGSAVLSAQAEGYSQVELTRVAPSNDVELVLLPESSIIGRVVSVIDGQPVPDVTVSAAPSHNPYVRGAVSTLSDEAGEFTLAGLQPGAYVLRARNDRWQGVYPHAVDVELGSTNRGVLLTVGPAVRVSGRVLFQASGEPCRSGTVMLGPWPDPTIPRSEAPAGVTEGANLAAPSVDAQTVPLGVDGSVVFEGVTAGRYHVVMRCMDGFLSDGPQVLEVAQADLTGVTWKVSPSLNLKVRAVDEANVPAPHTTVVLKFEALGAPGKKVVTVGGTDAGGSFLFRGLLPGRYEVQVNGVGSQESVTIELRSGDDEKDVLLKLQGSSYILVNVKADGGFPVDGLHVETELEDVSASPVSSGSSARRHQQLTLTAHSLGDGIYRLGPLVSGSYRLTARDGTNAPVNKSGVRVSSGSTTELGIELSRGASITGKVVDDHGGSSRERVGYGERRRDRYISCRGRQACTHRR